MFGWVWQVQCLYWTDTTSVANHANASYCLFVLISGDGGFTWQLYAVIYDPSTSPSHTSLDMVNPKMAIDVSGYTTAETTYDQFYIAYEFVKSPTDHDVYVYSDTSTLPFYDGTAGGTSNPHTIAIATSTHMEKNPAIASEYKIGGRHPVPGRGLRVRLQRHGLRYLRGSVLRQREHAHWTTAVAVASHGGYGDPPRAHRWLLGWDQLHGYAHLAYNYDTFSAGTQPLLNPGFESGNNGELDRTGRCRHQLLRQQRRTGSCCAWLGGVVSYPNDWIYQQVTIPSLTFDQVAQFSFWLKITTAETVATPHDYFYAEVDDTSGEPAPDARHVERHGPNGLCDLPRSSVRPVASTGPDGAPPLLGHPTTQQHHVLFRGRHVAQRRHLFSLRSPLRQRATHPSGTAPGTTPYPTGLANFTNLTILANAGGHHRLALRPSRHRCYARRRGFSTPLHGRSHSSGRGPALPRRPAQFG